MTIKIGFVDILAITFIVLKFLHVIDWSWPVTLIPVFVGVFFGLIGFVGGYE